MDNNNNNAFESSDLQCLEEGHQHQCVEGQGYFEGETCLCTAYLEDTPFALVE